VKNSGIPRGKTPGTGLKVRKTTRRGG